MHWAYDEQSKWLLIQKVSVVASVVLFFAGLYAIAYRDFFVGGFGYNPPPPYQTLGLILLGLGVIIFVVAYVTGQRFAKEEETETHLR